jgi:hypothetical protein
VCCQVVVVVEGRGNGAVDAADVVKRVGILGHVCVSRGRERYQKIQSYILYYYMRRAANSGGKYINTYEEETKKKERFFFGSSFGEANNAHYICRNFCT